MHQLGIRTHAELTDIPAADYDRWQYFFAVEPAGFKADNRRAGIATATLFNAICGLKDHEGIKPDLIFPDPHRLIQPLQPVSASAARNHLSSFKKLLG